jgi:hypothetical protein
MKTKSKEFQLKITPGAALKCPRCGREDTLNIYDGDSIPTHESMLDATTVAGGLALSKRWVLLLRLSECLRMSRVWNRLPYRRPSRRQQF